jgi:hypothetical protein
MDEEQKTVNPSGEENIAPVSSTEETKTPEVKEEPAQPEQTEKPADETKTEGGKKLSGAEKRIHTLVDERDKERQKAQDLEQKLTELTSGVETPARNIPQYQPAEGASQGGERELTLDDLRAIARLEVEKERTVNRINTQAIEAIKLNPELDKKSDQFDSEINEAVTTAVWLEIQKDPSKDVLKLTEKYMRPYRKAAEKAVGAEKEELTRQVNDEALHPNVIKPVDKKFEDKSIKEMEEELGVVY